MRPAPHERCIPGVSGAQRLNCPAADRLIPIPNTSRRHSHQPWRRFIRQSNEVADPSLAWLMKGEPAMSEKADVLQGTLDLMVLQTLDTMGPQHGYAVAARLEKVSGGKLQLNMGTLYPALMRLEQRGLVRGKWSVTETSRRARYYTLTAAGRRQLAKKKEAWDQMAAIIHGLLEGKA
jgi:PadR family transcriptional regulator, regulatory protein PadR